MTVLTRSITSVTLARHGHHDYQLTLWQDGVARYDGHSGPRQGAWEAAVPPNWFQRLAKLARRIEPGRVMPGDSPVSLVVETTSNRFLFVAADSDLPDEFWLIGTLLDGISQRVHWTPLDTTGEHDFAKWALGTPLWMGVGNATASAFGRSGSLVVLAGGYASPTTSSSLEPNYQTARSALINDGSFVLETDHFRLARHLHFASPSAAASVLVGSNTSGRRAWRNSVGRAWSELDLDHKGNQDGC